MADGTLKVGTIQTSSGTGTITLGQSGETLAAGTGVTIGSGLGKILQIQSAVLEGGSANKETTSASFVTATLEVAITPSATSSKILVMTANGFGSSGDGYFTIYRDDTTNLGGATYGMQRINATTYSNGALIHLDAPSSTSEVTYTVYFKAGSGTSYVNNTQYGQMIAMEIAG